METSGILIGGPGSCLARVRFHTTQELTIDRQLLLGLHHPQQQIQTLVDLFDLTLWKIFFCGLLIHELSISVLDYID